MIPACTIFKRTTMKPRRSRRKDDCSTFELKRASAHRRPWVRAVGSSLGWEKRASSAQRRWFLTIKKNPKMLTFWVNITSFQAVILLDLPSLIKSISVYFSSPSPGGPALHGRPENHSRTFQSSWQQAQKQIHQHRGLWVSCKIWLCLPLWIPIMFIKQVFIFF